MWLSFGMNNWSTKTGVNGKLVKNVVDDELELGI